MDKLSYYSQFFDHIRAYVVKKGFIMSHIPIHTESLSRWELNIHGHLHANEVTKSYPNGDTFPDYRYFCASVEHTEYRPILLDKILTIRGLK